MRQHEVFRYAQDGDASHRLGAAVSAARRAGQRVAECRGDFRSKDSMHRCLGHTQDLQRRGRLDATQTLLELHRPHHSAFSLHDMIRHNTWWRLGKQMLQ